MCLSLNTKEHTCSPGQIGICRSLHGDGDEDGGFNFHELSQRCNITNSLYYKNSQGGKLLAMQCGKLSHVCTLLAIESSVRELPWHTWYLRPPIVADF